MSVMKCAFVRGYLNAKECLSKADHSLISALYQCEVGNLSFFISGYSSVLKRDLLIRAFSIWIFFFCVCMRVESVF